MSQNPFDTAVVLARVSNAENDTKKLAEMVGDLTRTVGTNQQYLDRLLVSIEKLVDAVKNQGNDIRQLSMFCLQLDNRLRHVENQVFHILNPNS